MARFQSSGGFERPLLAVVERSADLSIMLQHPWSYCALCHDLLGLRLSRVTTTDAEEGSKKTHDLHAGDSFWAEHLGAAFQDVAVDVDNEFNEYRAAMDKINASNKLDAVDDGCDGGRGGRGDALAKGTKTLVSTINVLPELQEVLFTGP